MKSHFNSLLFTLTFVLVSSFVYSQPCPPGCVSAAVPIDGGISFLIVAGAAYGIKKMAAKRAKD